MGELVGLSRDGVDFARIESPRFGDQGILLTTAKDGPRTARLAPVGRLVGRVKEDDPGRARGMTIQISTSLNGPDRAGFDPEGHAEVSIGDGGRFEVPMLAVEKLHRLCYESWLH
jgi:hypothetical protein